MLINNNYERRPGDDAVFPKFFKNQKEIATDDGYNTVSYDYVEIWQVGKNTPLIVRKVNDDDKQRFYPEWNAYENNIELKQGGVDIGDLPTITVQEIKACKNNNIHTIEQLAVIADVNIKKIGMGGRRLVNCAKQYLLENATLESKLIKEKDERIANLEKEIAQLKAAKPKRGRKKKVEYELIDHSSESGKTDAVV